MTHKGNKLDILRRLFALIVSSFLAVSLLSSCSTVRFYGQALRGQMEISTKARPVEEFLKDPNSKPKLKEKLTTVGDIRAFAETDLKLPAKGQYETYANLGRPYAVWVIFAAPEFSVEALHWWYPLVGSVKYRGFFTEAMAQAEADRLQARGLDVYMSGVEAYSTLGYLKDPLLNTFLGRPDAALAELVFHELTHQRIYLPGDTDFNEALATAVGREGTRRWLRARKRGQDLATYEKDMRVEQAFVQEVLRTRTELDELYHRPFASDDERRAAKQAAFASLKKRLHAMNRRMGLSLKVDRWFQKPLNNARLNTLATYYDLVPGFEALLHRHGGDLEAFFTEVQSLRRLPPPERRAYILKQATLKVKAPAPDSSATPDVRS